MLVLDNFLFFCQKKKNTLCLFFHGYNSYKNFESSTTKIGQNYHSPREIKAKYRENKRVSRKINKPVDSRREEREEITKMVKIKFAFTFTNSIIYL